MDLDGKTPLLSQEELDRISRTQSSWSDKAALHKQLTGELPIGRGCSFTQTVFNGELFHLIDPLLFFNILEYFILNAHMLYFKNAWSVTLMNNYGD